MNRKLNISSQLFSLSLFFLTGSFCLAQKDSLKTFEVNYKLDTNKHLLKGRIVDKDTKEGLPFAALVFYRNGIQLEGVASDYDGNFWKRFAPTIDLKNIKALVMSQEYKTEEITFFPDTNKYTELTIEERMIRVQKLDSILNLMPGICPSAVEEERDKIIRIRQELEKFKEEQYYGTNIHNRH